MISSKFFYRRQPMNYSVKFKLGASFQDALAKLTFHWNKQEKNSVPVAVRNALEALVIMMFGPGYFVKDSEYVFSQDCLGRPCLQLSEEADRMGRGFPIVRVLKTLWDKMLQDLQNSVSDKVNYSSETCEDFGAERFSLRRMELIDALLRVSFYNNKYWEYRKNWSRRRFMDEVQEPNESFGWKKTAKV